MKYRVFMSMQKSINILHVKLEIRKNKRFTNILRLYLSTVLLFFGVLTINAQRNYWEGNEAKRIALTLDENLMFGNEIFTPFTIFLSDLSENFNVKSLKVASMLEREYSSKLSNEMEYGLVRSSSKFNARTIATNSLRLWLKANEGGTSWSDQSGHGINVTLEGTIASGFPLNYHRTNYFDGSGYYNTNLDISAETYPYLSVISVYVPFDDPAGALWGEGDRRNRNERGDRVMLDYKNSRGKWNNTIGGGEFVFNVDDLFVKDVPTISTVIFDEDEPNGSSAYVNGKQEIRFTSNHSPGTSNPLEIGRVGYGNSKRFKGRVGEVLVYSGSGQPSRNRIESYLALKYGITLDQTTPQSYVNSSGAEIYDADGLFNSFDHDIIGIGQDNGSSLDQRISKSINTGSILFLSKDTNFTRGNNDERRTSLGNGNFLVTGHNGGSIAFNSDFKGIPNTRMTRIWGLDQTGIVDEVYVAIPVTGFENLESLYVVVSNDQTFDESDTYSKMTKQNSFWVGSINPSDGNFMSFMSMSASPGSVSNNIVAWLKSEDGINTNMDGNNVISWNNSVLNPVYNLQYFNRLNFIIERVSYALNSAPPTYESDTDNLLNFHPSILFQNDVSGLGERLFTRGVDNRSEILNAQPIKSSTFYAIGMPRGHFNDLWSSFDSDDPVIYDKSPLGLIEDSIYFHVSKLDENGEFEFESIPTNTTWENGEIALLKITIPNVNTTNVTYNKNGGADDVINGVYVESGYYHVLGNIGNTATPETGLSFDNHFGNIAETIIYGTASLSDVENSRIESYLALKYGITLDQTTPQSYVNSKGTEIYDADGTFDAFDHDIIGIGQDDGSSLDQRISKGAHKKSVLILARDWDFTSVNLSENRTSLGNGNFLMAGNNGESVRFGGSFEGVENSLMNRVWAFDKTGTVGNVYIAVSIHDVHFSTSRLYAVLSTDQTFDESDNVIPMVNDGTNWSAEINPEDGNFMTFTRSNPSPGDSDHTVAWLKSEDGTNTTTDGEDVILWENNVLNPVYNLRYIDNIQFNNRRGILSSLSSSPPSYENDANNLLNFHPSILFQDNGDRIGERLFTTGVNVASTALSAQPIQGSTLYAVGKPKGGSLNNFWTGFESDIPGTSNNSPLSDYSDVVSFRVNWTDYSSSGIHTTASYSTNTRWSNNEIALMKVTIPNEAATSNITYNKNGGDDDVLSDYYIDVSDGHYHVLGNTGSVGKNNYSPSYPFGNIAETIIYNSASISSAESSKIESYLALKYGITLDQTTPQSYVNSSGTEIYDPHGKFEGLDHYIIGIGEDDGSSLDQKISRSVHEGSILILSHDQDFINPNLSRNRTSLGDGNFLVTGNNGENTQFIRPFMGMDDSRMNRVWGFHKRGTVGDVYIALPDSDLNLPGKDLYVVLSPDRLFDNSDKVIRMKNDRTYWYAKINPDDEEYMTFVSTDVDLGLDLYIKDSPDDLGEEPNLITKKFWRSPDIWVRNNPDRGEEHQNPKRGRPNYVYVRVQNRSRVTSQGDDQVKLYWRKAGTVSGWPEGWTGGYQNIGGSTIETNGLVGTVTIPELSPGEEAILQFTWNAPRTTISFGDSNSWHFCFLARIVSENDPMTNEQYNTYTSTNARRNNNIAWKNVTVVKASSRKRKCNKWDNCSVKKGGAQFNFISFGGLIFVGNPFNEAKTFSLELVKEEAETGKAIFDEAEVVLTMNKTLYNAWKRGGKQSELLKNTNDEKKKIVTGNHARLNNLQFEPNEFGLLNVRFNFLTKELTDKLKFVYHVIQKEVETGEVVGGETYVINKDLQMEFEGSVKEDRKLEINNKTISIDKASLDKIIPNPASNTARFTYNLGGAKSAYLKVIGFYHGATKTSINYSLDTNSIETTIDLTNYSDGYYQVSLVCDGKVIEVKTLIKE